MKILLINNCHFRRGGADVVYLNTAKLLQAHGHEVVFFSSENKQNIATGGKEYFVPKSGAAKKMLTYFYNWEAARRLEEILTVEKPDIAHAHLMWGGINQAIFHVLKRHGVPLVHTAHDYRMVCPAYTFRDGKGQECERCQRWNFYECALHRCSKGSLVQSVLMAAEMYERQLLFHPVKHIDGFIFVSHFSEQKHIQHDKGFATARHTVLYNYTRPLLPPLSPQEKGDYFLFFGRLSHEKGIPTLLKVFARHPELKLKVVGTGPLEAELKKLYPTNRAATGAESDSCASGSVGAAEKCYENIEFVGYHSGGTLAELVRSARFVCVPSEWYENNPMTIVESYSVGTPVIGANIGGIPEIIDEERTGFLFASGSVDELEQQVLRAASLPEEEYAVMCTEAYRFYEANFSAGQHYQRLTGFYDSVINKQ